ncbi:MAG: carboxypeptidase regulatory-like domain-containing protein [Polyangiaceae bacterium]|nr:carboxypeptidase regulatory-like domain-containing protein [Polyangiaceae bacterium]
MRKPPRLLTLVLGLLIVALAIWRFFSCANTPAKSGETQLPSPLTGRSANAHQMRPGTRPQTSPMPLLSAAAEPDTSAPLGAFEGRVVSSQTNKPIARARLVLENGGAAHETVTDESGAFRFVPPAAGVYTLIRAAADNFMPFAPEWDQSPIAWTARPGRRVAGFVLALDPAAPFEILVKSPDGDPVEGASVHILDGGDGALPPDPSASFLTDKAGIARATVTPGSLVGATHPNFGRGRARVSFGAQATRALTVRLRAKTDSTYAAEPKSLSGRVLDPTGKPLAGAKVVATRDEANRALPGASLHPRGFDISDNDGTFAVENVDDGNYELTASHAEYGAASVKNIPAGSTAITLSLLGGGSIEGTVTNDRGDKVAAFSVIVLRINGPLEREQAAARSFLDADGRYEIEGLAPGSYEVLGAALGLAPSPLVTVTIADPPRAPAVANLVLGRGFRLSGTVVDAKTNNGIAEARIELEGRIAGAGDLPTVVAAVTKEDGTFVVEGVARGVRSLAVTATGHHGRIVSGVSVGDSDPPPLTIQLTPTAPGEEPGVELVGIGAVLTAKDNLLLIGQILPGGGAAEVGLAPGDGVLAIDGVPVTDLGFEGAIDRIRGPEGSTVLLTIRKSGVEGATDLLVPRRRVKG